MPERNREDLANPSLLTQGNVYRIEVKMEATRNWGARPPYPRTMVEQSFPHGPEPITGENNGTETRMVVAQNTIHYDRDHPAIF